MYIENDLYDKFFTSNELTRKKYDELMSIAVKIRDLKNEVSQYVNKNLSKYLLYSRNDFIKEMRKTFAKRIPSSFDVHIFRHVLDCYKIKFDNINKNIKFERIEYKGCELYKANNRLHKKGDFKSVKIEKSETSLSKALTFLAQYNQYYDDNAYEYLLKSVDSSISNKNKKENHEDVLRCINKFGYERLNRLAKSKRDRIFKKYLDNPCVFKTLSFCGRSRKSKIVDYNSNYNSKINAFISLSSFSSDYFYIPVKYSKDYHGHMKDYFKENPDYEYTICFNEKKHQVVVHLYTRKDRYIPDAGENTIGIDVNSKHNLLCLSDGTTYDYDRDLVNEHCKLMLSIDRVNNKNKNRKKNLGYVVGKRKRIKMAVLKKKMLASEQRTIASMCKDLQSKGINHIVMEDIDNQFKKTYAKDASNNDINYNRKLRFLGLGNTKHEVEHIGRNYGIALSTVNSSYTSQMCPICGCIDRENRATQEDFKCIECGYESNADVNAANNIKNRVDEAVLRKKLLKQLGNGAFEPKPLKKEKVKEELLSFRKNLIKKSRRDGKLDDKNQFVFR